MLKVSNLRRIIANCTVPLRFGFYSMQHLVVHSVLVSVVSSSSDKPSILYLLSTKPHINDKLVNIVER